ncbi:MAG: hypothetical protein RLZZ436_1586 [Planctomycetota bacterium]|jgi:hypothetical protein
MPRLHVSFGWLLLAAGVSFNGAGCASSLFTADAFKSIDLTPSVLEHGTEQRVLSQFTEALEESNERAFRRAVSTRFEQHALRSEEAFRDLEILKLPKGTLEIVESKKTEAGGYETVAKEKDGTTRYQFMLVRDPEKKRWVVDDVMLRQQKKGTRSTKSSVELMDLLLTLREFLGAWQAGGREEILSAVSGDLRQTLESLPEPWLEQLSSRIISEYETGTARRPEIQMNETDAVGRIPAKNGFFLVKLRNEDGHWAVADIECRNRRVEHHPGSLLRQARAMSTICGFLDAWSQENLPTLERYTEEKFFNGSLRVGDLSTIPLPAPAHAPEDFEIQSFAGRLTVMIPWDTSYVRLDLVSPEAKSEEQDEPQLDKSGMTAVEVSFRVSDVTLYDRQTSRQTNLRAAFTAPARAMLFMKALADRDLPILRQISSRQLTGEVWSRMEPRLLEQLPLDDVPRGDLKLVENKVLGDSTELQFEAADGRLLSVTMQDENGNLAVMDVQYPGPSLEVASLKTQLLLSRPLIEFANAWESGDVESLKTQSSAAFNRLVWSNLGVVPDRFVQLPRTLKSPIRKVDETPDEMRIELGRSRTSAMVRMVREKEVWVVDEITLTPGTGAAVQLRKSLRDDLAARFLSRPTGALQPAGYTAEDGENAGEGLPTGAAEEGEELSASGGVVHAVRQSVQPPRRGNLTLSGRPVTAPASAAERRGLDLTPAEPALRRTPQLHADVGDSQSGGKNATAAVRGVSRAGLKRDQPASEAAESLPPAARQADGNTSDLRFGPSANAPVSRATQDAKDATGAAVTAPKPARRSTGTETSTRALNERPVEIPLE